MLSRSGYQEDLSSSLIVGQQLSDVPARRLQVPVHRDGQPAVLAAAPHPWAQDGVLGVCRGVEEEEGTCQETRRVSLQCPDERTSISSVVGFRETNGIRVSDAGSLPPVSHLLHTANLFPAPLGCFYKK